MKLTFLLWVTSQIVMIIGSIEFFDVKWYYTVLPTIIYILHFPLILLCDFIRLWWVTRNFGIDVEFKDNEKLF